ncbi:GNAT family N-acetyltransferase [Tsuneonella sp. HG222]
MTDDLDRIMEVMVAAFDPTFGEAWNRRQVGESLVLPHTHYLLAGPDGESPQEDQPTCGFLLSRGAAGEEELLLIAVHPDHRHKGIGRRLIERLAEEAGTRGTTRLFLEMRDGNPAASLYLSCDFVPVGRRKNYYRQAKSGPIDAVTFARQITPLNT